MLTLHCVASSYTGPYIYNNRKDFFFRVDGLPRGIEAQVRESYGRWQNRRRADGAWTEWRDKYGTKEQALAALEIEIATHELLEVYSVDSKRLPGLGSRHL